MDFLILGSWNHGFLESWILGLFNSWIFECFRFFSSLIFFLILDLWILDFIFLGFLCQMREVNQDLREHKKSPLKPFCVRIRLYHGFIKTHNLGKSRERKGWRKGTGWQRTFKLSSITVSLPWRASYLFYEGVGTNSNLVKCHSVTQGELQSVLLSQFVSFVKLPRSAHSCHCHKCHIVLHLCHNDQMNICHKS